jgi:hypothetical protein
MSFNEVTSLYCQIGGYLEDCKEYYENIDKYIKDETEYISDLFEQIEESKKSNDIKKLTELLIEVRSYVISLRSNPKLWKYTN